MNYKKMTFRASMLGLIVMLFAGLVSCSSDDDDKNIPVEETKVPTTGAIVFLYAATEDELSICDMIADTQMRMERLRQKLSLLQNGKNKSILVVCLPKD